MKLTPVEFEIMEIVWNRGSALVRDVHRELYTRKGLAYTTVMTEMTQMYRKGILAFSRRGRAYLYTPRVGRQEALEETLEEFVTDFFHGSRDELASFINIQHAPGRNNQAPVGGDRKTRQREEPAPQPASRPSAIVEEDDVTLL